MTLSGSPSIHALKLHTLISIPSAKIQRSLRWKVCSAVRGTVGAQGQPHLPQCGQGSCVTHAGQARPHCP